VLSRIPAADQAQLITSLRLFTDAAGEPPDTSLGLGLSL
jgi:hypothetical protein